jgi:hypothetical protein
VRAPQCIQAAVEKRCDMMSHTPTKKPDAILPVLQSSTNRHKDRAEHASKHDHDR